MGYRVINGRLYPVGQFPTSKLHNTSSNNINKSSNDFNSILKKEIGKQESFTISNHAAERLRKRNIDFTKEDMKKINEAINKASDKGCKDSVIFFKDTALITSIKNRTIITAVDKESSKDNVFTNIDSVVLL
jgi:flagellar operon protein